MTKHIYRYAKTSWGIWIEIDCLGHSLSDFVGEYISVSDNLHFSAKNMQSSVSDKWFVACNTSFKEGLLLIANNFDEVVNRPIVIEVIKATYNWTDFQTEGYGYGIANWVIKEYNLNIELPYPIYNKAKNRYTFPYEIDDKLFI